MNNEYIYIFDYCTCRLLEYKVEETDIIEDDLGEDIDTEAIFDRYGLNQHTCSWLFSSEKLEIETLN